MVLLEVQCSVSMQSINCNPVLMFDQCVSIIVSLFLFQPSYNFKYISQIIYRRAAGSSGHVSIHHVHCRKIGLTCTDISWPIGLT